jgi:hypothetical protein
MGSDLSAAADIEITYYAEPKKLPIKVNQCYQFAMLELTSLAN